MKFLVIQQKMIGDVLASTIICESLKHHFPTAEVHMVAYENTMPVLEGNPHIDRVVVFKNEFRNSKTAFFRFLKTLKKEEYTASLDAYGKLESNLITLFSKANKTIGNRKWYTKWLYSDTIRYKKQAVDNLPLSITNRLMLLDPLVKNNTYMTSPKIYLLPSEITTAKAEITSNIGANDKKIVMVSILGSAAHKTYPASYMAAVLDAVCAKHTVHLLFNYIPHQKAEAMAIFEACAPETQACIAIDFYAQSLRGFIGLLSQCALLIGNEGGAVNMAKALDIPTFAIFSPYILKQGWHGTGLEQHACVHLNDYYPELFKNKSRKILKKESDALYQRYKPALFIDVVLRFTSQQIAQK